MKFRILATVAAVSLLAGCAQMRISKGWELYQADKSICENLPLARETVLKRTECASNAMISRMSAAGYQFMPLVKKYVANERVYAVEFAEGHISQQSYEAMRKVNESAFETAEAQAVDAYNARVAGAWQAFSASMPTPQPIQTIPAPVLKNPVTTNCQTLGNTLNCTTW